MTNVGIGAPRTQIRFKLLGAHENLTEPLLAARCLVELTRGGKEMHMVVYGDAPDLTVH